MSVQVHLLLQSSARNLFMGHDENIEWWSEYLPSRVAKEATFTLLLNSYSHTLASGCISRSTYQPCIPEVTPEQRGVHFHSHCVLTTQTSLMLLHVIPSFFLSLYSNSLSPQIVLHDCTLASCNISRARLSQSSNAHGVLNIEK